MVMVCEMRVGHLPRWTAACLGERAELVRWIRGGDHGSWFGRAVGLSRALISADKPVVRQARTQVFFSLLEALRGRQAAGMSFWSCGALCHKRGMPNLAGGLSIRGYASTRAAGVYFFSFASYS